MKLHLLCMLWIITPCECFLRLPSDFNVHNKAEIVVTVKEGKRTKRSTFQGFHPQSYDLDFQTDGQDVHLNLIRNDHLNTNVATLILNKNGLQEQTLEDSEVSVFFQDSLRGAAFVVQYGERSKNMFGVFNTEKGEYILQSSDNNTSLHHQGFSKFQIMKEKHEQIEYDDFLHKDERFISPRRHHINKRATGENKIELLIVCDYAIYDHWYSKSTKPTHSEKEIDALTTVRQYYAFVINGMDAMYKNIQTSSYTISILFAGIIITQSPDNSTWTETIKNTSFSPNRVDSSSALTNFHDWIVSTSGLPGHDHAMLFTRYDLTSSGSNGNVGISNLGALCTSSSQSLVEDGFDFIMITTASHELGHSLDAHHDGDPGYPCPSTDAYIMAASSGAQTDAAKATHPWKFSTCSTSSFTTYIDSLNVNCMKTLSSGFDPTAFSPYDQAIAGQVYDADAQCAEIYNSSSYMCRGSYNNDYTTICNVLWCFDPSTESTCSAHIAGEGTLCASRKWCVSGLCTANNCAPAGNDACLYGDRKLPVFVNGWTCADMIAAAPINCVNAREACCASCAPVTTTETSIITTTDCQLQTSTTQAETTTPMVTTTTPVTTTHEVTTTKDKTKTLDATTTQPDTTTTQAETTTPVLTTTQPGTTTTPVETTTPLVTTTQPDTTTTQAATTTPVVTTTQSGTTTTKAETTTPVLTTSKTETTTSQGETTTSVLTTTRPDTTTTQAATTTPLVATTKPGTTTTQADTTTPVVITQPGTTTTQAETTTPLIITTQPDTTTSQVDTTTTLVTTTQTETTTTTAETTMPEMTTPKAATTTREVTTATRGETTKLDMATQVETTTTDVTTTESTTPKETTKAETATPKATTQAETTTSVVITKQDYSTTSMATTKQAETTTRVATTTNTDTASDDSASTQEVILIGTGAAVVGVILLGIGVACITMYCRRLNKATTTTDYGSVTYPGYLTPGHTNAAMEYDEIVDTWAERKSQRSTQYHPPMTTFSSEGSKYGQSRQAPVWYPQYNAKDRISWNKFYQKGVHTNRTYDNSGFY